METECPVYYSQLAKQRLWDESRQRKQKHRVVFPVLVPHGKEVCLQLRCQPRLSLGPAYLGWVLRKQRVLPIDQGRTASTKEK